MYEPSASQGGSGERLSRGSLMCVHTRWNAERGGEEEEETKTEPHRGEAACVASANSYFNNLGAMKSTGMIHVLFVIFKRLGI